MNRLIFQKTNKEIAGHGIKIATRKAPSPDDAKKFKRKYESYTRFSLKKVNKYR